MRLLGVVFFLAALGFVGIFIYARRRNNPMAFAPLVGAAVNIAMGIWFLIR
jgi:hypothetical protein